MNYDKIQNEIKTFVDERDWEQFHSPKNLSMALSVEASELVEIFQWQKQEEYKENEEKVYQVLEVPSMETMQEALKDPDLAKLRTDAGVNLDSQEVVFLVE